MAITFSSDILTLFPTSVAVEPAYEVPGLFGIPSTFLSGVVTGVTVSAAGTGFTTSTGFPTVSFSNSSIGTGATGTVICKAVTVTVSGGTGYLANDTITLTNGVVLTVNTVSTGALLTATVSTAGAFTLGSQLNTTGVFASTTSVSGAGGTFTLAYGVASVTITAGGANYVGTTTAVFAVGSGSPNMPTTTVQISTESTVAQAHLTLIEILRSYAATVASRRESKLMATFLQHAAAVFAGQYVSNTTLAVELQNVLMHLFADAKRTAL